MHNTISKYVKNSEWEKAITLWKRYSNYENGEIAIWANYNLALGYEIKDQIPNAIKHLVIAERLAKEYDNKISPIRYPMRVPQSVVIYQTERIKQVPDWHPTNFQYKNPPIAPNKVKTIVIVLRFKKFFITGQI